MKKTLTVLSLAAVCAGTCAAQHMPPRRPTTVSRTAVAQNNTIQRVLLISVDGMHAVDFLNCANGISTTNDGQPYCPAIAALGETGVNYVAASTSKPSDSFPGLTA